MPCTRKALIRFIVALAMLCAQAVHAQTSAPANMQMPDSKDIPGADQEYPFRAQDLGALTALRHFTSNLGIGLSIEEGFEPSEPVNLTVTLSRGEYLATLAAMFDFIWYFDGTILFVSSVEAMETRVFSLQSTTGPELVALLNTLDVLQPKFKHRTDTTRQALLVSGPKSYLDVVAKVVEAVESAERQKVVVLRGGSGNMAARLSLQSQAPLDSGTGAESDSAE